jgi:hypothetical protein
MASIDGGHYFLTVLAPVRRRWDKAPDGEISAPIILLREKLAKLPTAMQTPESTDSGRISPFAASSMTHFARFAVIDRLGYNGYAAADPVLTTLNLQRPVEYREELARPYLLFTAEFDAPSGSSSYDLAVYLRELWDVMRDDLVEIFQNCVDFHPDTISTAADFISYIKRCEIETTMPFNYYWANSPTLPTLTARGLAIGAGVTALVLGGGAWWLLHRWLPIIAILIGIAAAIIGAIGFVAWRIKALGDKRFPAPPDSDLPSVLKALHLQSTFGQFVIANQMADHEQLHSAFGAYLAENRPHAAEPTHPAGKVYP